MASTPSRRLRRLQAHHGQPAGRITGLRIQALDDRRRGVAGQPAQRHAQHGTGADVDLCQARGRDVPAIEGDAAPPGQQAQLQPLPGAARGGVRAATEDGASGHPALAHRRGGVHQFGRRHQAVVGVVPADVETGAVDGVDGRAVEFEGGLVHRRLLEDRGPPARGVETVCGPTGSKHELPPRTLGDGTGAVTRDRSAGGRCRRAVVIDSQAVLKGGPTRPPLCAGVAQLVEQRIRNAKVGSSTLLTGTKV